MKVKQNVIEGNRANKGDVKWKNKWCTGATFASLKLVSIN